MGVLMEMGAVGMGSGAVERPHYEGVKWHLRKFGEFSIAIKRQTD